jgi:hypothetical protein
LSAEVCAKVKGQGDVTTALDRAVAEFNAVDVGAPTQELAM